MTAQNFTHSDLSHEDLIQFALELTNCLTSKNRFTLLLKIIRQTVECDAIVLLQKRHSCLKPLAQEGLMPDMLGRRFEIDSHPRFKAICTSSFPVRFAANCDLPDPYDGMLLSHRGHLPIHACMGLPLYLDNKSSSEENELIGVLTLDSMTPNIFDDLSKKTLDILSAMSAAALKTAVLLEKLEHYSSHHQQVVEELNQEALLKDGGDLIGDSLGMKKLNQEIQLVANSDFTVLIEGETGVGKELVARTLHQKSNRAAAPLVYVNCAAIPENLVESELFGHVKGAFTSALKNRTGKFSLADGGTIFLDEIGELPLAVQSKLLRVLQNKEIQPVGKDQTQQVDVRVLAATNRELSIEVENNRFRADLYHRLSVYPIKVPPLRDRKHDVTLLAGYFCEQLRKKLGLEQLILSEQALRRLNAYHWPGNVRELEHVISRAALKARQLDSMIASIDGKHIDVFVGDETSAPSFVESTSEPDDSESKNKVCSLKEETEKFQRLLIHKTLKEQGGNWSAAARHLSMDRANLSRLAKRLGIEVKKMVTK